MKSPIKWIGGKAREIKCFEEYIPNDFGTYIEPFFGGGAVYWHLQPKNAVINDINEDLINFYICMRDNYNDMINRLQNYINTKDKYKEYINILNNKKYNDNIERACIFYYLNRTAFSGTWRVNSKGEFNVGYGSYKNDSFKILDKVYSILIRNTTISNTDFRFIINEYKNNENTFIFIDPPYLECDTLYTPSQEFTDIYEYLALFIKNCKCKVMIVIKENDYLRSLFKNYIIKEYEKSYKCNAVSENLHKHLVICNYIKQ